MIDAGALPTIARLVEGGISGNLAAPDLPAPMLWTSIATGVPPGRHGVNARMEARPDGGGVRPIGASSWRAPPVWHVLNEAGIPAAVVNWPATAPADTWTEIVVDDRFPMAGGAERDDWPLPPRCISPARLRAALRVLRVHPKELDNDARAGLPAAALAEAAGAHAAATWIAEHEPWRFLAVRYGLLAADASGTGNGTGNGTGYRFVDAMVARLLTLAGPETDAILVAPGVLIAHGPGFAADRLVHGMSLTDVAPTVLARFGVRVSGAEGHILGRDAGAPARCVSVAMVPPSEAGTAGRNGIGAAGRRGNA